MKKILTVFMCIILSLSLFACGQMSGADGKSAYELAVENGYNGTVEQWLASLAGEAGANGENGKSAYEIAVLNGYSGTEEEWLTALIGSAGASGADGENGKSAYELACDNGFEGTLSNWLNSLVGAEGAKGDNGMNGKDGENGKDGKSAYELACENGYEGTLTEWLASLVGKDGAAAEKGKDGKSAYELACENGYEGDLQDWLASLVGANGVRGDNGLNGKDGKSAYELACENGYLGSEAEWLASLVGKDGADGRGIKKTEIVDGYLWITYNDGEVVNAGKLYNTYEGTEGLTFYLLPDGTYGVKAGEAYYLEDIIIPAEYNGKAVTQILDEAFKGAQNLSSITIPSSITNICKDAFLECEQLQSVYADNVESWCNIKFKNAYANPLSGSADLYFGGEKVEALVIPEGIETVNFAAFYGSNISSVTLPSTLTGIGKSAFAYAVNLTEVTIPAACNEIGAYAFYGTGLTSVTLEATEGWKLENNVSYVSATGSNYSYWKDRVNINKTGRYYDSYSSSYAHSLVFDTASKTTVANALKGTTTINCTCTYTGTGVGAGDVTKGTLTVNLYTEKWIRTE